jgi:hypothetical protein
LINLVRPLLILIVTLAGFAGSTCSAAIITFTGADPNVVDWRNPSVAKPLDPNGDNIYGTDGYVMFTAVPSGLSATLNRTSGNPFTFGQPIGAVRTLVQQPVYVSAFTPTSGFNFVQTSPTFTSIDNPTAPGTVMQSGVGSENGQASQSTLFSFTVNNNLPTTFVVGLFFNNSNLISGVPGLNQVGIIDTATGIGPSLQPRTGLEALFFSINGATPGEQFSVVATGPPNADWDIMGITFDTSIPEPTTLGGCAAAVLVFLWLGRRSKNPKQSRPV